MRLLQCILAENECYTKGRAMTPKGVMVHSTGANNPNLKRYAQPILSTPNRAELLSQLGANLNGNHWNMPLPGGRQVCVHGFIGRLANGSVAAVQTLPWNWRGWHAGVGTTGRTANDTHISFEICEDDLTDPVYFKQVYQTAVELTAMLCKQYGLNPLVDGVVICHAEGHRRGIASNHGDVLHWFPKHGKTMDNFRADVKAAMSSATAPAATPDKEDDDMPTYKNLNDVPESYRPTIRKLMERGALKGVKDPDPNSLEDNVLNISNTYCRVMTTLDQMGKLD